MKILAVCGFGVGSSMILKMTIQKAIRELGVDAQVVHTDISDAASHKPDVIFTSKEFVNDLERRTNANLYAIKTYSNLEEVKSQLQRAVEDLKQETE